MRPDSAKRGSVRLDPMIERAVDRLAAAGLADNAHDLARREAERHIVDQAGRLALAGQTDAQPAYIEKGPGSDVSFDDRCPPCPWLK